MAVVVFRPASVFVKGDLRRGDESHAYIGAHCSTSPYFMGITAAVRGTCTEPRFGDFVHQWMFQPRLASYLDRNRR